MDGENISEPNVSNHFLLLFQMQEKLQQLQSQLIGHEAAKKIWRNLLPIKSIRSQRKNKSSCRYKTHMIYQNLRDKICIPLWLAVGQSYPNS